MQNTSNYNLNIVEGTDIVNIPVQLNPNFQTIDAEMFKNKQGSTGTATEVVTGSVHAIVRANTDADIFRFTATGNWASGDTMTVDGSAVTVHLTDGTAPAAGAYVIGAEVVAVINNTLVTLISSSAPVDPGVTSFNTRVGAVTPAASDYDASMIDYDNTSSGLVATDVQSAIDETVTNLNTLAADVSKNNAASSVNINSYNTSANKYTAPSDGYVMISGVNAGDNAIVNIYGANDGVVCGLSLYANIAYQNTSLMVRKGMKMFVYTRTTDTNVQFIGLN